jgi:hypothetical protein
MRDDAIRHLKFPTPEQQHIYRAAPVLCPRLNADSAPRNADVGHTYRDGGCVIYSTAFYSAGKSNADRRGDRLDCLHTRA